MCVCARARTTCAVLNWFWCFFNLFIVRDWRVGEESVDSMSQRGVAEVIQRGKKEREWKGLGGWGERGGGEERKGAGGRDSRND